MFVVDGKTIRMSRGDTGTVTIGVSGYTFGSNDRALFTIRNAAGEVKIRRILEIDNNEVEVEFVNSDTDSLDPGNYQWDIRYVVNPQYDTGGELVDGDEVNTPELPMKLELLTTVGQI